MAELENGAIIKDDEIYNKPTQPISAPEHGIGIDTKNTIIDNIAQAAVAGQLDISSINSFTQVSRRRDEVYKLLDTMCEDSTIAAILETYAEDATEYNDNGDIVWVESDDSKVSQFVNYLLNTIQVNKHIYKWVYSLCKYGDLYLRLFRRSELKRDAIFDTDVNKNTKVANKKDLLNEDIKVKAFADNDPYEHYLEMVKNPAEMFELTRFGKTSGYIKADVSTNYQKTNNGLGIDTAIMQYKFKTSDVEINQATSFVHATLEDNSSRTNEEVTLFIDNKNDNKDESNSINYTVKRGQSLLYNVFKIWRELALLENSMLLNRITKSAIVRLINVEVGDMPKEMVGPHLQGIKAMLEQKSAINTGNSMTEYTNPGPIENNIYVPTHNNIGAITADQIGGDVNVGQLTDVDYFQNKFFGAMRIPKQYFGLTDDGAGFNGGQSLAIISSRYAKMIKRIQNSIIQALTDAINLFLMDKGLNSYINKFVIKMQAPTTQEEIDRRENLSSKVSLTRDILEMLGDVQDQATRMKITKILVSTIVPDNDILNLLDDEISQLENELAGEFSDTSEESNIASGNLTNQPEFEGENEPLNLDKELDLDMPSDDSDSDELPSPEELDIGDLSDNNIEI